MTVADAPAPAGLNLRPGPDDDGWETTDPVDLSCGTRLQLFKDGEALAAAVAAIDAAQRTVDVEVYILANDRTGRAFCETLIRAAERGVRVRLLYDSLGSLFTDRQWFDDVRAAGGEVREFHTVRPWHATRSWRPWHRDHRKMLVVDARTDRPVAGIGGLNVGTRYAGPWVARLARFDPHTLWRDAGIGIVGPGAAAFGRCFERTWRYAGGRGGLYDTLFASGLDTFPREKGRRAGRPSRLTPEDFVPRGTVADVMRADLGLLASGPTTSSPLRPILYRVFRDARESLWITMAYFAPDETMIRLLADAARRGVDVRLMLPRRSDSRVLVIAARSFYEQLMDAGVRILERTGAMLHAKHVVADGRLTVIGSTNLDFRSIETNLEASAFVDSPQLAEQMRRLFEHDMAHAEELCPDTWRERPWVDRVVQWVVKRARYIL